MIDFRGLPGAELAEPGLEHLRAGKRTIPALWLAIATTRLRSLGIAIPHHDVTHPEQQLYRLLEREDGDAYSRYNALLRRLGRFIRALESPAHLGSLGPPADGELDGTGYPPDPHGGG